MELMAFAVLVLALAWLCRRQLLNPGCHGFYRFFAFAGIAWLLVFRLGHWHDDLISIRQLVSSLLMVGALWMVAASVWEFRHKGGRREGETVPENFGFENTGRLVTTGIYQYIRHPMYASLLLLAWGIFLKQPNWSGLLVVAGVTLALYLTARTEERENLAFFGEAYRQYIRTSKLFLPFLL
ncbi:methyltransferase family protein [Marinobacter oulmenensis]|uniref:Protein-S-isoprenylcysteine O-methyltransferase Ste14 n=1 Tax=Marinobacter oulmenensis TaxID=643747 RepID=A0A840UAL5_9GAMM|nr:isoprenylcysteine carboxylmethyltransferase family protein [Marinobacter oulmenensis]MBB5320270.1 protein-S-isoprenylcysteine O-methyltransferase Ste14 [Marinobacter oulmenensis]